MAETKGINPEITPEVVKEEVKEATAEVVEKATSLATSSEKIGSIVLFDRYTLYATAAILLLVMTFVVIGISGNPLSYAPTVPFTP